MGDKLRLKIFVVNCLSQHFCLSLAGAGHGAGRMCLWASREAQRRVESFLSVETQVSEGRNSLSKILPC